MDENIARKGAKGQGQIQRISASWIDAQSSLAAASGLALLLVEGQQPPALVVANDNSICRELQTSPIHAHLCEPYCGDAFNRAIKAGGAASYRCHAGLHCVAMPVTLDKKRKLAVIGGRAFITTADYLALAERIRAGDLQDLLSAELFENVIFAANQDLIDLEERISNLATEYRNRPQDSAEERPPLQTPALSSTNSKVDAVASKSQLRSNLSAIDDSCQSAMRSLADKYQLTSIALHLRIEGNLEASFHTGRFTSQPVLLQVDTHGGELFEAARTRESLLMMETREGIEMLTSETGSKRGGGKKTLELFPIVIDNEVKAALLVADAVLDSEKRLALSHFCRELAFPLEILRLRDELERRSRVTESLQSFANGISTTNPSETYLSILAHSTELLHSERSSLLLYDEVSSELTVKAALGPHANKLNAERVRLGEGVSGGVMRDGRPMVVRDLDEIDRKPSSVSRQYKTRSFISYPISIRGRKLGVLNVTDKDDGSAYNETDLRLLETLAPQIALAMDRADWQEKAAQFQLISITDPLTGLLNRRYLEERLAEELKRSERQGYAMSFLMIDIDDFKFYNDQNGHQAGDLALEMTAQCLKSVLRAADVASRYGGEEFCILLPQTKLDEATAIAERIRQRVEQAPVPYGKTQPLGAVTVSIGVSAFVETLQSPAAIIKSADRALYLAKRLGKNMVHVMIDDPNDLENQNADERVN